LTDFKAVDGMRIWSLPNFKAILSPVNKSTVLGQITACTWINPSEDVFDTLCFGTGLGYLAIWRYDALQVGENFVIQ
jgi:hypothetical protein